MQHTRLRTVKDPCIIAGCGRYGMYEITRPINQDQTVVTVCRKCAAELTALYGWTLKGLISNS